MEAVEIKSSVDENGKKHFTMVKKKMVAPKDYLKRKQRRDKLNAYLEKLSKVDLSKLTRKFTI